jgi:chemotaxis methyl-accepting protein methylase
MLRGKLERLGISLGHLSFFEAVDATHIRATETLRDHVSFKELDVCEESLDPRRFHAVIINNVMTHYFNWKRIRALMTTNLALGLLPNGVITSNDFEPFPRRAARVAGLVEAYDLGGPSRGDAMWWRYQPRPAKPTIREWFTGVRP